MMRRSWFFAVPLLALLAFVVRSRLVHRSPSRAASASTPRAEALAPPAAVASPGPARGAAGEGDEDAESRARALASPVFSRLPPPDQRWVLAQARARLRDPHDPRLEQVVRELSEVRLFAVSEREEPLVRPDYSR